MEESKYKYEQWNKLEGRGGSGQLMITVFDKKHKKGLGMKSIIGRD